ASQHPEIVSQLNQLAADVDADLGRTEIGPGCRPLGRVAKPKPWIPLQRDGLSTRVSGNGD
ncbi:MAG: hypothetical protein RLZZ622_29, partial [Planctomycetota bacterium]